MDPNETEKLLQAKMEELQTNHDTAVANAEGYKEALELWVARTTKLANTLRSIAADGANSERVREIAAKAVENLPQ